MLDVKEQLGFQDVAEKGRQRKDQISVFDPIEKNIASLFTFLLIIIIGMRLPCSYFEKKWGAAWQNQDKEFWDTFRASLRSKKSASTKTGASE